MNTRAGMLALLVVLTSCGSSSASSSQAQSAAGSTAASSSMAQSSSAQGSTTPPDGPHGRCGPASATTLVSDSVARVYSLGQRVYGCAAGHRRSFLVGATTRSLREGRAGPVALAGTVAAYGYTRFGVDTVTTEVVVRRLTDGATLRDFPAGGIVGPESFQSVGSVVVKADGAVAWIGSDTSILGHRGPWLEVHAASGSSNSLLDSGPRIDPTSLRLHGSTLSWRDGAVTRHATLH